MIPITTFLADACTGQSIIPDLYGGLRAGGKGGCEVQIDSLSKILVLLGNAISIALFAAGFIAVGFIIYGGFQYILSSGDPSGIKKAKETIVNAVIGLVIAMLAFGIVNFLSGSFVSGPIK